MILTAPAPDSAIQMVRDEGDAEHRSERTLGAGARSAEVDARIGPSGPRSRVGDRGGHPGG